MKSRLYAKVTWKGRSKDIFVKYKNENLLNYQGPDYSFNQALVL